MHSTWYEREVVPYALSVKEKITTGALEGPYALLLQDIIKTMEDFTAPGQDAWSISLSKYLQHGDLDVGSNYNRNYNSQVRTKALLLERLATALGCTASDRFDTPRVPSNAPIPPSLKPIVRYAAQWPQYLRDLANHLSEPQGSIAAYPAAAQHSQAMHVDGLQPYPKGMINALSLLSQSRTKLTQAGRLIAEANMQLIAFMLFWHSTHNTPIPRDQDVFFKELLEFGQRNGISSLPPEIVETMTGPKSALLFQGLKLVVEVAVHISPLALLNSINYSNFSIDRRVLIKWGQDLGPKPPYVLAAEGRLWKAIMDITLGTGVREALGSFIEDCRPNNNLLLDMESQLGDYFVNGALKPDRGDIQPAAPPLANVIDKSTADDNTSSQEPPSNVSLAADG
ncbi:hypothetical protein FIBSPDRAFT_976457, partial [Athelia psychrophila]